MPPWTFIAAAAAIGAIYGLFSGKGEDDDNQGSASAPSSGSASTTRPSSSHPSPSIPNSRSRATVKTSTPLHHGRDRDPYYYSSITPTTSTVNSYPAPSASTHAQPSYPQPWFDSRAQATVGTKENLEPSSHVHHYGLASSRQTVPTSALHSNASSSAQSTSSYIGQQTSARVGQISAGTPTTTGYDSSLYRSDFASPSVWESRQTPSTPTRTHTSNSTQQTYAGVGQTTARTHTTTGYDSSLNHSDFASPFVWESRPTPSAPTRTNAFYSSTPQTYAGVGQTAVRAPSMADYDDMWSSPYSYLRPPSPDAPRPRVSRLTVPVSPQKHSRTQSSSSDSDYPGPSSRTRRSLEVHDAIAGAEDKKKARELRDQAKRSAREMQDARDRAKIAHRRGDREAESEYKQEARAQESAKKNLDKRAATIFFRVNNKVRYNHEGLDCYIYILIRPLPIVLL